jgi:prepilin-type N-terminal cleavage/methylation domain-containing protein
MKTPWIKRLLGSLRQAPWRMSDAAAPIGTSAPRRRARGFTLIEVMITTAVIGVLLGISASKMRQRPFSLMEANQQLLADLRQTRSDALTKGDHFRLDVINATTYKEFRLKLQGGLWVPMSIPVRSRTLPPNVTFTAGVGKSFEFNTRGLLILPGQAASVTLRDNYSGRTKNVTVWPSGQVAPL